MAYGPHILLQYGGTLGTAGEIWSNNLRFANADADADDPSDEAALTLAVSAIRALFTAPGAHIPAHVVCNTVKWNRIGPDGRYVSGTESNTRFLNGSTGANALIAGAAGTGEGPVMPFSVSVVVSLLTDFARGRGSRGRLYSPAPRLYVSPDGQIDTGSTQQIATAYANFMKALRSTPAGSTSALRPVVASKINGALNSITAVSVGSVPDTMRSRRNNLVETRAQVAVPA